MSAYRLFLSCVSVCIIFSFLETFITTPNIQNVDQSIGVRKKTKRAVARKKSKYINYIGVANEQNAKGRGGKKYVVAVSGNEKKIQTFFFISLTKLTSHDKTTFFWLELKFGFNSQLLITHLQCYAYIRL